MMGALLPAALGVVDNSTAGMMGMVSGPCGCQRHRGGSWEILAVPEVFLRAGVWRTLRLDWRVIGLAIAALLRHGAGLL
jgi:hypothetical protein